MKTRLLSLMIPAALLLGGGAAQARVDSELILNLKYRYQRTVSVKNGVENAGYGEARFDSKQLLTLISRDANLSFKKGSKLMITPEGDAYVVTPDGKNRTDVTRFVSVDFDDSEAVFGGKRYLQTGRADQRRYYLMTVRIKVSSLETTFTGLADETSRVTQPDRNGVQITTSTIRAQANGKGHLTAGAAFYEGSVQLKGRVAEVGR